MVWLTILAVKMQWKDVICEEDNDLTELYDPDGALESFLHGV